MTNPESYKWTKALRQELAARIRNTRQSIRAHWTEEMSHLGYG